MARRRPLNPETERKLNEHRQKKTQEHLEKLRTDQNTASAWKSGTVARHSSRRVVSLRRRLGPKGKSDRQFSECCTNGGALTPLMRVRPDVAAEVLLAVLIEDEPEESYGTSRFDEGLGLKFDMQSLSDSILEKPVLRIFANRRGYRASGIASIGGLLHGAFDRRVHKAFIGAAIDQFGTVRWHSVRIQGWRTGIPVVRNQRNACGPTSLRVSSTGTIPYAKNRRGPRY